MNGREPGLARALALALEAERAFGIDEIPRGPVLAAGSAVPGQPVKTLENIAARIAECRDCGLCETRTRVVPGQGHERARLMFVGEAPGFEEDRQGLAFVGLSGQLLTKMIEAIGLSRDEVFIANILKCRPPENREPSAEESQTCFHYLEDQIDLIQPELICALGATAANGLLDRSEPMHQLRGRVFDYRGAKLVPTYHPSYLLRRPVEKKKAWEDLQRVAALLGLDLPGHG
ncbi:MAG: uracil-DNA glycosylase [Salinibacterium sp.]|nr:uracil-DNA glycosylase [Planctomycetota bacterium]MCB1282593.1 uracil-DNA glycosylase [Salinibacterium sp.]